jgi:choline dehydrogenase-like flavoprotein
MTRAFVMACQQYGIPYNHDFNGATQAGAGYYQLNVVEGRRCSAARGYLDPARRRPNLKVVTGALSQKLIFEGHRARRAYRHRGQMQTAHAESEVIVTAGAIGSPKLLMLSGIGPGDHLKSLGIEVRADVPGSARTSPITSTSTSSPNYMTTKASTGTASPTWRRGRDCNMPCSAPVRSVSNVVEGGLFWYSGEDRSTPDLQFHFLAGAAAEDGVGGVAPGRSGITLNCYGLRPKARGTVRLASPALDSRP